MKVTELKVTEQKDGAVIATEPAVRGAGVAVSIGNNDYAEIRYTELPRYTGVPRHDDEGEFYVALRFAFEATPRCMTVEAAKGLGEALIRVAEGPPECPF